jgi:hypothetical protein
VLRLVKAKKKYMETVSRYMKLKPSLERIFTTFVISFIIFHITSCLWHVISGTATLPPVYDADNPDNWKFRLGYSDSSILELYLVSFYWTIQTVVTVGYGDLPAKTSSERCGCFKRRVIAVSWMFIGVFVYSFLIGSVSSIFFALDSTKQEHRHKMDMLTRLHAKHSIPPKLLRNIRNSLKKSSVYKRCN